MTVSSEGILVDFCRFVILSAHQPTNNHNIDNNNTNTNNDNNNNDDNNNDKNTPIHNIICQRQRRHFKGKRI